ncbi:uncharacterized protein [Solanum lycopersicum]|uniref:uncharacterized protein n=1 Tax=Solanum lycopersicum TaxID=4081 RepID=UPI0008FEC3E0|nr:late secretory pathway protein AVL9-like [Solanum lycopersicum]
MTELFFLLSVDTMGFLYLVDLDEYPKEDIVHCNICETRIGLANDFIDSIDYEMTVVFHKMCNVQVDEEKYHRQVNGNTVADTYCVKCGMLLGMKLIVVPYSNQTLHHREEYFLMNALELIDCNNKLMYLDETEEDEEYEEQDDADANEHDHDQGGEADEQGHNDDGGANEHDQNEEDEEDGGGGNEHHHDQGGGTDDQDGVNEHEDNDED